MSQTGLAFLCALAPVPRGRSARSRNLLWIALRALNPCIADPSLARKAGRGACFPLREHEPALRRISLLLWTTTRSAGGYSCFLAKEQSRRTAWRARSLLSRTTRSSRPATPASCWRITAEHGRQRSACRCCLATDAGARPGSIGRPRTPPRRPQRSSGSLRYPLSLSRGAVGSSGALAIRMRRLPAW